MPTKLYVGNLAYSVTDSELEQMFAAHGTVQSAQVIMGNRGGTDVHFGRLVVPAIHEGGHQAGLSWRRVCR